MIDKHIYIILGLLFLTAAIPFISPKYAEYNVSLEKHTWGKTEVWATANLENKAILDQLRIHFRVWDRENYSSCKIEFLDFEVKPPSGAKLNSHFHVPDLTIKENEYLSEINGYPHSFLIWASKDQVPVTDLNIFTTIVWQQGCAFPNTQVNVNHSVNLSLKRMTLWKMLKDMLLSV